MDNFQLLWFPLTLFRRRVVEVFWQHYLRNNHFISLYAFLTKYFMHPKRVCKFVCLFVYLVVHLLANLNLPVTFVPYEVRVHIWYAYFCGQSHLEDVKRWQPWEVDLDSVTPDDPIGVKGGSQPYLVLFYSSGSSVQ